MSFAQPAPVETTPGRWESGLSPAKLWIACVIFLIALWAAIGAHLHQQRGIVLDLAVADAKRLTAALSGDLEKRMRAALAAIDLVTASLEHPEPDMLGKAALKVRRFQHSLATDFNVRLIGPDGTSIDWPTGVITRPVDLSDRDYVARFLPLVPGEEADFFLGRSAISRITGQPFVPVARLAPANTAGVHVISAAITLAPILELQQRTLPGPNGAVGVFRTDGAYIVRTPFDERMFGRTFSGPLFQALKQAPEGFFDGVVQTDGVRRKTAYATVPEFPMVVAVGFAIDDALGSWYAGLPFYFLGTLIVSGLIVAAAARIDGGFRREQVIRRALSAARDRAEAADRAKSQLLANVSHELRTPLNAIIGFSEIMRDGMFGPMPDRYAGYASDIHDSADHLRDIVEQVLSLSEIDAGARALAEATIPLPGLLEQVLRMVAPLADRLGVSVDLDGPVPEGCVTCDALAMREVLLNLLGNAVKMSPRGSAVEVSAVTLGDFLVFRFADRGPGFPAEVIDRLGQPFNRPGDATVSAPGGKGLGLSIAIALVRLHGGGVMVHGRADGGSVVQVSLPLSRYDGRTHHQVAREPTALAG